MPAQSIATSVAPVSFSFENHTIRAVSKNGEAWFVAEDVCSVLGLTNPSMALKALDEDEYSKFNLGNSGRGNPNVNIINESGLYALILKSRKLEAKRFRKWVTSEVLPAIRKTGKYSVSQSPAFRLENGQEYILSVDQNKLNIKPKKAYNEDIIRALSNPDDTTVPDETLKTVIDVCVSTLHYRLKAARLKTAEADLLSDPLMKKALPKGGAK